MPEFTDYNNFELPEPFNVNERNQWGRILNDALDEIDDKVIRSGTIEERPQASDVGRLYLDNDSGTLYRDNGSTWQRFGSQTDLLDSGAKISVNPNTINFSDSLSVTQSGSRSAEIDVEDDFIFNSGDTMEGVLDMGSNDLEDGTQTIWDASVGEIPDSALGQVDNATLTNDSITINANDGLKSGGVVSLGGAVGIDIEPSDFAGLFLQDDGSDNLAVLIGRGLENDGTGDIRVDEDTSFNFTGVIDFASGLQTDGDITDTGQVIWDTSAQEIPDSAMGTISNSTLANSSLTLTAGDGLKNAGTVSLGSSITIDIEPNDFAGSFLQDEGADNLGVLIGRGLENDGSGNIRFDEDTGYTFTTSQTFNAGATFGANVDAGTNQITNLPAPTSDQHAARKQYVDGVAQGLNLKESVEAATDGTNINLASATDPNPIDGYTLSNGERVLLKNQTAASENGIYVANTATDPTTWTRAADFDQDAEVTNGAFTFVSNGTNEGDTSWIVTTPDPITVGTTAIEWSQFASAGEITAGNGLSKTGQTLDVNFGTGVELNGDNIRVDEDYDFTFTSKLDLNGGINLNKNDIDNVSSIEMDGSIFGGGVDITIAEVSDIVGPNNGDTSLNIQTQGDGTHDVTIRDGFNNRDIAIFGESGNVSIPSGELEFSSTNFSVGYDGGLSSYRGVGSSDSIGYIGSGDHTVVAGRNGIDLYTYDGSSGVPVIEIGYGEVKIPNGDIESGDTNSALEIDEETSLIDTGKAQLSRDARPQGYAMIQNVTNGTSAMVYLGGAANTVEILHDSGSGNEFTTTEGNQGTTNIYYDSTNTRYEINNETGASATYSFQIMKA